MNVPGSNKLTRCGFASLGIGLILLLAVSVMNRRSLWLPLEASLPLEVGEQVRYSFTPEGDGPHELQIEADDTMGRKNLLRYLTDFENPSEMQIDWLVMRGDEPLAAGDSTDFLYIERGPESLMGRVRRIALRIPYCQNRAQWLSLGLAGSATSSRGIGRFEAIAGQEYTILLTPAGEYPVLTSSGVTFVVRPDRRRWHDHAAKTIPLAYAGLLALMLGGGLVVLGWLLRRFQG